jgi:hypothetical protein
MAAPVFPIFDCSCFGVFYRYFIITGFRFARWLILNVGSDPVILSYHRVLLTFRMFLMLPSSVSKLVLGFVTALDHHLAIGD